jgi:hypothetical protein
MNIEYYTMLFSKDINRLIDEVKSYQDEDSLWKVLPGTTNSAGNLAQHLIGNLKTYIGNPFGNIGYVRDREAEFAARLFTREELIVALEELLRTISFSLSRIPKEAMDAAYPREILSMYPNQSIECILVHLLAHLSYHLGQINYHRRFFPEN